MDASKITELRQKQNTVYIKRTNTVDSSTMTWKNQIQSSKYIKGVATCTGLQNTDVPTEAVCSNGDGTCSFGGGGKGMTLTTGSTKQYPSVYRGAAGSASEVYSSDKILLQKAGRQYCAELITDQDAYTILPTCYAVNTNGPTLDNPNPSVNNQDTNPYLPAFDTYYKFKNPMINGPIPDKNLKHFVQTCNGCVVEPVVTRYGWPLFMFGSDSSAVVISNSIIYNSDSVFVTGTFSGTINLYDGNVTHTVTTFPTATITSNTSNLDTFLIKYDQSGKIQWVTTMQTTNGTQTTGYSLAIDSTGVYVSGYMDGTINCYNGTTRDKYWLTGSIIASLTTNNSALYVLKYNLNGYLVWTSMVDNIQSLSGPNGPEIQPTLMSGICADGNNHVYVCNYFNTSATVYYSNGLQPLTLANSIPLTTQNNSTQGFLVQYNAETGATNWATELQGDNITNNGTTNSMGLVCDRNNVYMSGFFNNSAVLYDAVTPAAPTFGAYRYKFSNGLNNGMFIVAYNTSGVVQWANHGGISNFSFVPMGIQLTVDGSGVYVLVPFPDVISLNTTPQPPGNGGGSYLQLINTGGSNTYNIGIVKYTLSGTLSWINKIMNVDNGSNNIFTNGFSLSSDGSALYVVGGFGTNTIGLYNSSTSGDPSPQVATLATAGGTNTNTFLIKYNLLGALQWSTLIGKSGSYAYGYSVSANTNLIYVSGTANGSINLYQSNGISQPTQISASITPPVGTYFYTYVVKYDNWGNVVLV